MSSSWGEVAAKEAGTYGSIIVDDPYGEPAKLNIRRRFWRWLLGYEQPLYTRDQLIENTRRALNETRGKEEMIDGNRRFQIINAMNGKIIRFTGPTAEELTATPNRIRSPNAERYYVVPEDADLLGSIATVLALDRIEQK